MIKLSVVNFLVLLVIFLYYATEMIDSSQPPEELTKEASPMWFGPRIGRKKRNPIDRRNYRDHSTDQSEIIDMIRESPMVVFSLNKDNKIPRTFIPRLGRELTEPLPQWTDEVGYDGDTNYPARSGGGPFSPRLGRNNFVPRLGRDSDMSLQ